MEVHHHSHTPTSQKKKWTHYFWEFLMLFLAVFCGFLAEYQLEHLIEKQREKQFMITMVDDLESDIQMISYHVRRNENICNGLDSIRRFLYDEDNLQSNTPTIYRLNAIYLRMLNIEFNDQTIVQLRNSGGLRLVKNQKVTKGLASYWKRSSSINDLIIKNANEVVMEAQQYGYTIFDRRYVSKVKYIIGSEFTVEIDPSARLMTTNPSVLTNYANRLARLCDFNLNALTQVLLNQKQKFTELRELIIKEYHLK